MFYPTVYKQPKKCETHVSIYEELLLLAHFFLSFWVISINTCQMGRISCVGVVQTVWKILKKKTDSHDCWKSIKRNCWPQGTKETVLGSRHIDTFAKQKNTKKKNELTFLHIDKRGLAFIIYAIWRSLRQANKFLLQPPHVAARQQKIQDASARYKTPPGASHQGQRWSFVVFRRGGQETELEMESFPGRGFWVLVHR